MENDYKRIPFTGSPKEILEELHFCRDNNGAVGIWSSSLGKGMFLCFVKEVIVDEDEDDIVVVLNETDLSGSAPETHVLFLYEIEKIYRFRMTPGPTLVVRGLEDSL